MTPMQVAHLVQWLVIYASGRYVDEYGMLNRPGESWLDRDLRIHLHGVSARARDWLAGAAELYVHLDVTITRDGDHTKPYSRLMPGGAMNDPSWTWLPQPVAELV